MRSTSPGMVNRGLVWIWDSLKGLSPGRQQDTDNTHLGLPQHAGLISFSPWVQHGWPALRLRSSMSLWPEIPHSLSGKWSLRIFCAAPSLLEYLTQDQLLRIRYERTNSVSQRCVNPCSGMFPAVGIQHRSWPLIALGVRAEAWGRALVSLSGLGCSGLIGADIPSHPLETVLIV